MVTFVKELQKLVDKLQRLFNLTKVVFLNIQIAIYQEQKKCVFQVKKFVDVI